MGAGHAHEPTTDIDIIRRAWSGPLDPIIPADQKGFSSRAIIDATKPFPRLKTYTPTNDLRSALTSRRSPRCSGL